MNNGYYLFIYSCIDEVLNYYGTSDRTDHNMALFHYNNGYIELVHHWEFERLSGEKHHMTAFPDKHSATKFINMCLKQYGLSMDDLEGVLGTEGISTEELLDNEIYEEFTYHSLCHLMSCLLVNSESFSNKQIIGLALDGGPDLALDPTSRTKKYYCGAKVDHGKIEFCHIPSPATLWLFASKAFHEPEGTLMALAYATETKTLENLKWNSPIWGLEDVNDAKVKVDQLIQHVWEYRTEDIGVRCTEFDDRFTDEENKISIIMKVIQEISIDMVENTVQKLLDESGISSEEAILAVAGGYALNCPTNSHLMKKFNFSDFSAPPAVNDAGQSIGMGLLYFYMHSPIKHFVFPSAYLGGADDIGNLNEEYKQYIVSIENGIDKFVDDIETAPIIWFDGRSECGPRALGHRSILASPTHPSTKKLLNQYKQRQWWRPVAPIVLREEKDKWFKDIFDSPYMLNNFSVIEERENIVNSILHLDGTARVQTLTEENDAVLYNALKLYFAKTGIPILANTSLNDKGEPIVESVNEALNFALRKKIPIIYFNGKRIKLDVERQYKETSPQKRNFFDFKSPLSHVEFIEKYNPYYLSPREILLYKRHKEFADLNITVKAEVDRFRRIVRKIEEVYVNDVF